MKSKTYAIITGFVMLIFSSVIVQAQESQPVPDIIEENVTAVEEEMPFDSESLEMETIVVKDDIAVSDNGVSNEALFEQYVDKQFNMEESEPVLQEAPMLKAEQYGVTLEGATKELYELLSDKIIQVAAGEIENTVFEFQDSDFGIEDATYTAEELGVESILNENGTSLTLEAKGAYMNKIGFDLSLLNRSLLYNHPYELYWYDKTCEGALKYSSRFYTASGLHMYKIQFSMIVSSDYSKSGESGTTEYNTDVGTSVNTAVTNADNIVKKYESYNDYEKLTGYRETICELVTYYDAAASDTTIPYGNPWQIIWVFDNNPNTNVVCEGYAKAFDYLCSKSTFRNTNTRSYLVSGLMGDEKHMWNLVTFGSENYLVDVTNCDGSAIGAPDKLFLTGTDNGSVEDGYTFTLGSRKLSYKYDDSTRMAYTSEQLTLSSEKYTLPITDSKLSISLNGDIGIRFSFQFSDNIVEDKNARIEIALGDKKTVTYVRDAMKNSEGYYQFIVRAASPDMSISAVAQLYDSNGYTGYYATGSVKKYCDYVISQGTDVFPESLVSLVKTLLNFGGYSQQYFNRNTNQLANDGLSEADKSVSDVTDTTLLPHKSQITGSQEGIKYVSSALKVDSTTTLRHTFMLEEGYSICDYVFYVDGQEITPDSAGENHYYVTIPDITAWNLDTKYVVTAGVLRIEYSPLSYAYNVLAQSDNERLKNVVRAIYKYNMAADAYFG